MNEIIQILQERNVSLKCVETNEISDIERKYNIKFPGTYITFLQFMGKGAGKYMSGSDVFYDSIFKLKEYAKDLLQDNNFLTLPNDAFVFWMHQGYQIAYFRLSEGDNPPVYYFSEGRGMREFLKEESFESFLKKQLVISDIL